MRDAQQKEINGLTYTVTPMPAGVSVKTLARVAKLAGPALGKITGNDAAGASGVAMLADLLGRLDGAELDAILRTLAEHTVVDVAPGKSVALKATYDMHFGGALDDLVEWALFALTVNYGPLAARLGAGSVKVPGASAVAAR